MWVSAAVWQVRLRTAISVYFTLSDAPGNTVCLCVLIGTSVERGGCGAWLQRYHWRQHVPRDVTHRHVNLLSTAATHRRQARRPRTCFCVCDLCPNRLESTYELTRRSTSERLSISKVLGPDFQNFLRIRKILEKWPNLRRSWEKVTTMLIFETFFRKSWEKVAKNLRKSE